MMINNYADVMEKVYKALGQAGVLKDFRRAMLCRAECTARDLIHVHDIDDRTTPCLRGQLSICFELADGAKDALENAKGDANSSNENEIRPED